MTTHLTIKKFFRQAENLPCKRRFVYGDIPWWRKPVQAHWQAHCWATSGMSQLSGPFPRAQAGGTSTLSESPVKTDQTSKDPSRAIYF